MMRLNMAVIGLLLVFSFQSCKNSQDNQATEPIQEEQRIVSLNGTLTEILSQLGYEEQLVAVDVTSVYPESVKEHAVDLGHVMNLSVESLLQQRPTEIYAVREELSEDIIGQLSELEIPIHYYSLDFSIEGAKALIKDVAQEVGAQTPEAMLEHIDQQVSGLQGFETKPKVMFMYARGAGTLLVAGNQTPAAAMIELAGGENILTDYNDYRPLTTEAVVQANPDVLLIFDTGLRSLNGIEGLREIPGLANTTAVQQGNIIAMDGQFLTGFGPRTGDAVQELNSKLSSYAD